MNLNDDAIERAAQLLASARTDNRLIEAIPDDCRPRNLADAYRVRDRLVELAGNARAGWFCACTNQAIQRLLALDEPYYAYLLDDFVMRSPARLRASEFPPIVLECEFGFRLDRDLPSRSDAYTRAEVEQAIGTVHPTIEVVAGHLRDWPQQDVFSVIADNGTDGALVYGDGISHWRDLDLVAMAVTLSVNGSVKRRGTGANVLGDPLGAFVWLINVLSRDGHGAQAGQIHNTGTATDIIWLQPGDAAVASFDGLGEVHLTLD